MRALTILATLIVSLTSAMAAQVTYYDLPEGAYPHDVAPAPDGSVWYTGQAKGFLGRFDPKTNKNVQIPRAGRCTAWRDRRSGWRSVGD